jgi:hypothetical protein
VHHRAAVTLGAHFSKDRLVQACMRLRKLDKGQTVTFCIPSKTRIKTRESKPLGAGAAIAVEDVLLRPISETHTEIRRGTPLWTVQVERFVRNEKIWETMKQDGKTSPIKAGAQSLLENKAQLLDDRYRPRKAE